MKLLVIPKLQIHNANALSSPFTIGFPAMTAWLGFVHALQRKLNQQGYPELKLLSCAVVSHEFNLQTYKGPGDFEHSIIGTGNPLDKDGSRPAFIEEARCHLTVSLVVEYYQPDDKQLIEIDEFAQHIERLLNRMKVAGGDIQTFASPYLATVDDDQDQARNQFLRRLMPGYVLIERSDLMQASMAQGQDAIDALLDHLTVNHACETMTEDKESQPREKANWYSQRKTAGWIVPIAVGYQGLSPLGTAVNQRDPDALHCFAESIVTLGEFKLVSKVQSLDDILWAYNTDLNNHTYLCQQITHIDDYV